MTIPVDPDKIEAIVGAKRHPSLHIARVIDAAQRVYILHPSYPQSTCTPACWTLEECDTCGRRIPPNGRSVPILAAGGYCSCDPEPATRAHLWDEHDDARHYTDPQGWAAHVASCAYCQGRDQ